MKAYENQDKHIVEEWLERLAGVPTALEIPSDNFRLHDPGVHSGQSAIELSADTVTLLHQQSQTLSVPPHSILLAVLGLTLSRWTGESALLIGFASGGDTVPVRLDVEEELSVQEFLCNAYSSLKWSLERQDVSSSTVAARLGVKQLDRGHPLVQAVFGVHGQDNSEKTNAQPAATQAEGVATGRPKFDLAIHLDNSSKSFLGHVAYATDLWDRDEAGRFTADYSAAVEQLLMSMATEHSGKTLADIRCISANSRKILEAINDTNRVFPKSSVDALFRVAAERWPTVQAVRDVNSALTYSELAAAATEQACLLRTAGVREGDTVLVGVPRSVAEVVALLGTLWAGATYVGVDLAQPQSHTARIIAKVSPAAAIVTDDDASLISSHDIRLVPSWQRGWEADGTSVPYARPDPNRLAYITFTSGSTGEPKGVAIPHRGVIRLVHDGEYLGLGSDERILRMSPLAFDASTFEIWGSLLAGGTLEVCPPESLSLIEIADFLAERQITVAFLTSGLFRLVQEFTSKPFGSLRRLLTGGDIVPYEQIKQALTENPGLVVTHCYGPTENTTFTTLHSVRDSAEINGPITIGVPVPGTRIYVLDKHARLLMPGAVGELYCAGDGLAVGYLNDSRETDLAFGFFSPDVPELLYRTGDMVRIDGAGKLHFIGRKDDQVKVRGFRIELHAISKALIAQEGVKDSVVTVTDGDSVSKKLIAAVQMEPGVTITPADLSKRLRVHLPSYMIPHLWAVVEQLPVTANGKFDRRKLAVAAKPASAFAEPCSA